MTAAAGTAVPLAPRLSTRRTRREEILQAAAELFASRGFHGVTTDDIGAAVGVSGPALYRHFPTKEAILAELLGGISELLLAEATARSESGGAPVEVLDRLVEWQVRFALDHPDLITVQSRDLSVLPEEDRGRVRRLQRGYVELWVDALVGARPELSRERARAMAHATIGLVNSTPHSARLDRPEMAALLRGMARAALGSTLGT